VPDLNRIREQLPIVRLGGYFNGGHTGPLSTAARTAIDEVTAREHGQGRLGRPAVAAKTAIDLEARVQVARLLHVPERDVALTQHTTDGMNIVANGLRWQPGDNAVTTRMEHKGGILPLGLLRRRAGLELRAVEVSDLAPTEELVRALVDAIDSRTRLVVVSHVSYVNGAVLPLAEIVAAATRYDCLVLVDGAQAGGVLPLDVLSLGVDGYAISGQKWLCGPEGTGALYLGERAVDRIEQSWIGHNSVTSWTLDGSYEPNPDVSRYEVGTRSMATLAGFAASIRWLLDDLGIDWIAERAYRLAEQLRTGLAGLPGASVLTPANHVGLVSVRVPVPPEEMVHRLEDRGFQLRSIFGYDCLRASVGFYHTEAEVEALLSGVQELLKE
jgi:L-cysteine/cystine lyase